MAYNEIALSNAQEQELTSEQVAAMGYSLIAELAEVELGPNGESPPDFFYQQVRTFVVNALRAAEEEAALKEEEELLAAYIKIAPKDSALKGKTVFRNEDGELVIR